MKIEYVIILCCVALVVGMVWGTATTVMWYHGDTTVSYILKCLSNNGVLKHDNTTKIVTTWTQDAPCLTGAGGGSGIFCGHSSASCLGCNCTSTSEVWCDNETLELERIRQAGE
jgi:hypothetical protein